jgi:hypothetical protein
MTEQIKRDASKLRRKIRYQLQRERELRARLGVDPRDTPDQALLRAEVARRIACGEPMPVIVEPENPSRLH